MDALRVQDSASLCHFFGARSARDIPDRSVAAYLLLKLEAIEAAQRSGLGPVLAMEATIQAVEIAKAIAQLFGGKPRPGKDRS